MRPRVITTPGTIPKPRLPPRNLPPPRPRGGFRGIPRSMRPPGASRPRPRPKPLGDQSKGPRPIIDERKAPRARWLFRPPTVATAIVAGLFSDTNPGDGTISDRQLAQMTDNRPTVAEWPADSAMIEKLDDDAFSVILLPSKTPFAAPLLVPTPERPVLIPNGDPMPEYSPVVPAPAPRPRTRPEYKPGGSPVVRPAGQPASPGMGKTHVERTLSVQPVRLPSGKSAVRVKVGTRRKYEMYARTRRKVDIKGVYIELQKLVTVTFGTLTEVQDFVDAVAWNVVDEYGRPAMLLEREAAFQGIRVQKGDYLAAAGVNMRQYNRVFAGLASGKYSLDLGGAAYDLAANEVEDRESALYSKARQRMALALGSTAVTGLDMAASLSSNINRKERQWHGSLSTEVSKSLRPAFAQRVYWHRSRGLWYS